MTANPGFVSWERAESQVTVLARALTRLRAALRRRSLDRALARGSDPSSSGPLAHRAVRLTKMRSRRRLAASIRGVLSAVDQPVRMPSAQLMPNRGEVLNARDGLEGLQALLLSPTPVYAVGMARLELLLTDGGSALYLPEYPGALSAELEALQAALEGREEGW